MSMMDNVKRAGFRAAYGYLDKDPEGLVVGDEVILLRQQGGQKYIVVDRIG